jgi:hypothetical protein
MNTKVVHNTKIVGHEQPENLRVITDSRRTRYPKVLI